MADATSPDAPRLVTRAELPRWALDGLIAMRRTLARGGAKYTLRLGGVWRSVDGRLSVWSKTGTHNPAASCGVAFAYPLGLAAVIGGVVGLRYGDVVLWCWILGAILLAVSIAGFVHAKSFDCRPGPDVVLLVPDGLVRIEGGRYQSLSRGAIESIGVQDGALVVASREAAAIVLQEAKGERALAWLAEHEQWLKTWAHEGALPEPGTTLLALPPRSSLFYALFLIGFAVAVGGLTYATIVMPARSRAGEAVTAFIGDLAERRMAPAYQRLSRSSRENLEPAAFEESLPPPFLAARGFTVNGLASATSFDGQVALCIDGWLDGVARESAYAFALRLEDDTPTIHGWREGQCHRQRWWREGAGQD